MKRLNSQLHEEEYNFDEKPQVAVEHHIFDQLNTLENMKYQP